LLHLAKHAQKTSVLEVAVTQMTVSQNLNVRQHLALEHVACVLRDKFSVVETSAFQLFAQQQMTSVQHTTQAIQKKSASSVKPVLSSATKTQLVEQVQEVVLLLTHLAVLLPVKFVTQTAIAVAYNLVSKDTVTKRS